MIFMLLELLRYPGLLLMCLMGFLSATAGERELELNKHDLAILDGRAHQNIESSGILLNDTALIQYLEKQISKLNPTPVSYRVKVMSCANVNAFSYSDGTIYIALPILGLIDNEAQLVFLLVHEIAHVECNHQMNSKYELHEQTLSAAQGQIVASIVGLGLPGEHFTRTALSGFSRQQEREADSIAIRRIVAAGYNAWEAKEFFSTMYSWLKFKEKATNREYATHPKLLERHKACKRQLQLMKVDTSAGIVGYDSYTSYIQPHLVNIAGLLLQSNSVQELYSLSLRKIAAHESAAEWHYFRGKILETYCPIDSFKTACDELKKACSGSPPVTEGYRDIGWLFLKKGHIDSARYYLNRYLQSNPQCKDSSLVRYYLGRENE